MVTVCAKLLFGEISTRNSLADNLGKVSPGVASEIPYFPLVQGLPKTFAVDSLKNTYALCRVRDLAKVSPVLVALTPELTATLFRDPVDRHCSFLNLISLVMYCVCLPSLERVTDAIDNVVSHTQTRTQSRYRRPRFAPQKLAVTPAMKRFDEICIVW